MSMRLSPRSCSTRWLALPLTLGLAAATACDRGPIGPAEEFEPRMAPGVSEAPFTVVVTDGAGDPVAGAVARLINSLGLATDLPPTDATGTATLVVANDDYCVTVRMAPPAAMAEPVIVPDDVPAGLAAQLPLSTEVGPVLFTKFGPEPWTGTGMASCLTQTPTKHNGTSTTLEVALPVAAEYVLKLVGPDGLSLFDSNPNLQQVVGYAVSSVPTNRRPGGFTFDSDLEDGFLQFVALADRPATPGVIPVLNYGFAVGQPVQIEFQQSSIVDVTIAGTTEQRILNFTATLPTFTAVAGTDPLDLGQLVAEPLFCNQQFDEFPKLNSFVSVNVGYMAEANVIDPGETTLTPLLLARLDVVPLELVVKGDDQFTVSFREDLVGGSRNTSDIVFTCLNGLCATQSQKTSGGSGHYIVSFFRTLNATAKTAKATFFLTGLTVPNDRVTFSVKGKGTGESIPLPSRKNTSASETQVQKPAHSFCPVQDSNDDKFFIGF